MKELPWLDNLISSALVLVVAALLLRVLLPALKKIPVKTHGERFHGIFSHLVKWLVCLAALALLLEINGVDVSSFIAGLGLMSIIVGLALQDFLKDLIMGIHILMDGFYNVGDAVYYQGKECIVTEFNLITTRLRLPEDDTIIVLCNRNVEEIQKQSPLVDIDIPLSYEEDVPAVREILHRLALRVSELPGVTSAEFLGTQEFSSSAIRYRLRFRTEPAQKPELRRQVNGLIQDAFREAGITIPYDQLDVHIKK